MLTTALIHAARPLAVAALAVAAIAVPAAVAGHAVPARAVMTAPAAACSSAMRRGTGMRTSGAISCSMPGGLSRHASGAPRR